MNPHDDDRDCPATHKFNYHCKTVLSRALSIKKNEIETINETKWIKIERNKIREKRYAPAC